MSVSFPKPLTDKEEKLYIEAFERGDVNAGKKLVEHNLRLVAHVAKKYSSPYHTLDDFISIGTIGLIKAVNTFTSCKSTRLATYAARCIENEILMSIRSTKKLSSEVSINLPIGKDKDGNEISLNEILGTDSDDIINQIDVKIHIQNMLNILSDILSDREQKVLIYRYGLSGSESLTQREVAKLLGISRSYVSRIEKKAIEKMREAMVFKQEKA